MMRVHVFVTGRVQGVGFRNHAKRRADQLGLRGWVRNLPDGGVEILAQGREASVDEFVAWCHHGPVLSQVLSVRVENEEATCDFWDFKVIK
jgi:acylphosphatase